MSPHGQQDLLPLVGPTRIAGLSSVGVTTGTVGPLGAGWPVVVIGSCAAGRTLRVTLGPSAPGMTIRGKRHLNSQGRGIRAGAIFYGLRL